jgi:hypothetical protein
MPTWVSNFPGRRDVVGVSLASLLILAMIQGSVACAPEKSEPGKQLKTYLLIQKSADSDIDEDFLEKIDSIPPPFPAGGPYQIGDIPTLTGEFEVYKFTAEYVGPTSQGERPLHDLLVIKTDRQKKILDAVHYTLDWTDMPTLDLFRFRGKGVTLRDGLRIEELKLANVQTGSPLAEEGIIVLNK